MLFLLLQLSILVQSLEPNLGGGYDPDAWRDKVETELKDKRGFRFHEDLRYFSQLAKQKQCTNRSRGML